MVVPEAGEAGKRVCALARSRGAGKTTVLLHQCIQIVIGGSIFGHDVVQSGPIAYLIAEDDNESIQSRLWKMCGECQEYCVRAIRG
jgi:RecA-family ATPase